MATSGANGPGSATASASNPRKFSEKIALQKQRQAEETAAFEEVMMDIGSTRVRGRAGERNGAEQLRSGELRGGAGAGAAAEEAERGSGRRRLGGAGGGPRGRKTGFAGRGRHTGGAGGLGTTGG